MPSPSPRTAPRARHFAFHVIADLPEFLIRGKERGYLEWFLRRKAANPLTFSEADLDEYLRILRAKVACAQGWLTIALPPLRCAKPGA